MVKSCVHRCFGGIMLCIMFGTNLGHPKVIQNVKYDYDIFMLEGCIVTNGQFMTEHVIFVIKSVNVV